MQPKLLFWQLVRREMFSIYQPMLKAVTLRQLIAATSVVLALPIHVTRKSTRHVFL